MTLYIHRLTLHTINTANCIVGIPTHRDHLVRVSVDDINTMLVRMSYMDAGLTGTTLSEYP